MLLALQLRLRATAKRPAKTAWHIKQTSSRLAGIADTMLPPWTTTDRETVRNAKSRTHQTMFLYGLSVSGGVPSGTVALAKPRRDSPNEIGGAPYDPTKSPTAKHGMGLTRTASSHFIEQKTTTVTIFKCSIEKKQNGSCGFALKIQGTGRPRVFQRGRIHTQASVPDLFGPWDHRAPRLLLIHAISAPPATSVSPFNRSLRGRNNITHLRHKRCRGDGFYDAHAWPSLKPGDFKASAIFGENLASF